VIHSQSSVGTLLIQDTAIVVGDGSTGFGCWIWFIVRFWFKSVGFLPILTLTAQQTFFHLHYQLKPQASLVLWLLTVTEVPDGNFNLNVGVNFSTASLTAPRTWTLPASPSVR